MDEVEREHRAPRVAGYTILRRDRDQPRGKEQVRAGGVLIGVHQSLAFKESSMNLRGREDKITEFNEVEILLCRRRKLRVRNIYIPPSRTHEIDNTRSGNIDTYLYVVRGP